jgi:phosphohistidine phosphatase SixA
MFKHMILRRSQTPMTSVSITKRFVSLFASAFALILIALTPGSATEAAWARLAEGEHTILLRHAIAPGTGDPAGFKLGDCSTQRNLSEEGRQQARRIGLRLTARAVAIGPVLTSQWCRAADTAKLGFPRANIIVEPSLNSFFSDTSSEPEQTAAARKLIANFNGPGNQVMVTHQVNITALTGVTARQGEAIIVDGQPDGSLKVIGRLLFD